MEYKRKLNVRQGKLLGKLQKHPKDGKILSQISEISYQLSNHQMALEQVLNALEQGDQTPQNYSIAGYCLFELSMMEDAGDAFEKALKLGKLRNSRLDILFFHYYSRTLSFFKQYEKAVDICTSGISGCAKKSCESSKFGGAGALCVYAAGLQVKLNNTKAALSLYESAHQFGSELIRPYTMNDIWLQVSLVYQLMGYQKWAIAANNFANPCTWKSILNTHQFQLDFQSAYLCANQFLMDSPNDSQAIDAIASLEKLVQGCDATDYFAQLTSLNRKPIKHPAHETSRLFSVIRFQKSYEEPKDQTFERNEFSSLSLVTRTGSKLSRSISNPYDDGRLKRSFSSGKNSFSVSNVSESSLSQPPSQPFQEAIQENHSKSTAEVDSNKASPIPNTFESAEQLLKEIELEEDISCEFSSSVRSSSDDEYNEWVED